MPVYLFALSQVPYVNITHAIIVFVVLHLLVYPSSNGYNSYMDRDDSPIGALERPLMPTRQLYQVTLIMDALAVVISLLISIPFAAGILLYILASRAYSARSIRLKQYPVIGFLTVFFFQGAMTFFVCYHGISESGEAPPIGPAIISSLMIGALYPLTQVYQHQADAKDGVTTISMLLGRKGSFVFSGLLFTLAALLLFMQFRLENRAWLFLLYAALMAPVIGFFLYWCVRVWKDENAASFRNSLLMSMISTLFTSIFFIILIKLTH